MPAHTLFAQVVEQEFAVGGAYYGELGLSISGFEPYVWTIVCKFVGSGPPDEVAANFARQLYLRDLYLTYGCVLNSDKAWRVLYSSYRKFVMDLVKFSYRNGTDAEDVADAILVSLYLPDRSGQARIASYNGRSSLATWLRVIVMNRAINERHNNQLTRSSILPDVPDHVAYASIELTMRAGRYQKVLHAALSQAFKEVTPRQRLMLLWRYDEELPLGEMAQLLGIHQSNVTRQLRRLQIQLRKRVIVLLASEHGMSVSAIQECLADIVDNSHHSISVMSLIRDMPAPAVATACKDHVTTAFTEWAQKGHSNCA